MASKNNSAKDNHLLSVKIAELLDKSNMKPYTLSRKAGVDAAMVYRLIEGSQKDIMLSTAFKIADALGVDVNEFRV